MQPGRQGLADPVFVALCLGRRLPEACPGLRYPSVSVINSELGWISDIFIQKGDFFAWLCFSWFNFYLDGLFNYFEIE